MFKFEKYSRENESRRANGARQFLFSFSLLLVLSASVSARVFEVAPMFDDVLRDAGFVVVNRGGSAQGKPSIANDIEATDKKSKGDAPGVKRGTTKGGNSADPRSSSHRGSTPRTSAMYDVVFLTGTAGAEIFVQANNGRLQSLGQTGADGKLSRRMPRGVYTITASRAGYNAQRQQVEVRPGNNAFNFNLTGQPLATGGNNNNGSSSAASGTIEEVLHRYLDPKRTDSVSVSDWQLVQTQTATAFAQNPDNPQIKAQSLFAQGQLAYLRGDYPNAIIAFNNSALALPTSSLAFYGLGNALLASNRLPEALTAYLRANELGGGLAMAYKGAGDVLSKQGKSKVALSYYERARLMGYSSNNTSLSAARNLMKMKRWPEALKELTLISKTQASSDLFVNIGDCYVELEQPLSAAPAYKRAMQLDPKSAIAHAKYGEVMYDSREYAAAAEALERALALDSTGTQINRKRARKLADESASKVKKMK